MGSLSIAGSYCVVPMEHNDSSDRGSSVAQFYVWRMTAALEGIELILYFIFILLAIGLGIIALEYLWPTKGRE